MAKQNDRVYVTISCNSNGYSIRSRQVGVNENYENFGDLRNKAFEIAGFRGEAYKPSAVQYTARINSNAKRRLGKGKQELLVEIFKIRNRINRIGRLEGTLN